MRMQPTAFLLALSFTLTAPATLLAQRPSSTLADSARFAVQEFYNWYVPAAAHPHSRDIIMLAATHGPIRFDPELVKWLRIDSTARAQAKDEIDGLDGDPFLNAQDPCNAYVARAVRAEGTAFLIDVTGRGGCAQHRTPDVTVRLGRRRDRWVVVEFLDPQRKYEGLIPLLRRLHPSAKQRIQP